MEDSVGFQVCNPELLGIVKDAASFDANLARSWVQKQNSQTIFSPHVVNQFMYCKIRLNSIFHSSCMGFTEHQDFWSAAGLQMIESRTFYTLELCTK